MSTRVTAYEFPNGFQHEADRMYGWLRHANLTPAWGPWGDCNGRQFITITLPESEMPCLRLMQVAYPACWPWPA